MKTDVFLETKNVVRFKEAVSMVEDMTKGQPGLMVVYGQAGRGKTECSETYATRTGAVYFRVLEGWTPRAMLANLCHTINGVKPRTVEHCKDWLMDYFQTTPRTILVDEADRFRDVGLFEHFRDIHDRTGAPVVFIGELGIYSMLNSRRRLWSRVNQVVEFKAVQTEDIILFALKASGLKIDPAAAGKLTRRCEGDFRLMMLDVLALEQMGRAGQTDHITPAMVASLPTRKMGPKANFGKRRA